MEGLSGVTVRLVFDFFIVCDKRAKSALIERCQHGVGEDTSKRESGCLVDRLTTSVATKVG